MHTAIMKNFFYGNIMLPALFSLLSVAAFSQQTPKTPQELEAYIKNLQKKADSMQKVMESKPVSNPGSAPTINTGKQQGGKKKIFRWKNSVQ